MNVISLRQLMWNMLWRSSLFGLLGGTLIGCMYGIVIVITGWLQVRSRSTLTSSVSSLQGIGAIVLGLGFTCIVGAIIGGITGSTFGISSGAIVGIVVGAITRFFFFPLRNSVRYQQIIRYIVVLLGIIGSGASLVFQVPKPFAILPSFAVTLLVALIAVYAWILSPRVVNWYIKQQIA